MLDLSLKNYVDWRVSQVMPVRSGFGYRVFLRYPDGSEKPQQKSGFKTEKEANKELLINNHLQNMPNCVILCSNNSGDIGGKYGYKCRCFKT